MSGILQESLSAIIPAVLDSFINKHIRKHIRFPYTVGEQAYIKKRNVFSSSSMLP